MPFDHYVSQAILKRWADPREDEPKVWVYTFESGEFVQREVSRLFGREGLNPPDVELRLNQLWESPLTQFREKDLRSRYEEFQGSRTGPRVHLLNNRPQRRALGLAFAIQAARVKDALSPGSEALAQVIRQPEPVLEYLTNQLLSTRHLSTISMLESHMLMLSEHGFFGFPVADRDSPVGLGWAYALPLEPRVTLLALPVACQEDTAAPEFISTLTAYSVGAKDAAVVVPAAVVASYGSTEELVQKIVQSRAQVLEQRSRVEQLALRRQEMAEQLQPLFGQLGIDMREVVIPRPLYPTSSTGSASSPAQPQAEASAPPPVPPPAGQGH